MNVFVYGCCSLWHNTEHQSESVVPLFRIHRIMKTRAWVYVYICEYTHTNTRSHLNAHVCVHAHAYGRYYRWIPSKHPHTLTHTCMCARTCMYARTCIWQVLSLDRKKTPPHTGTRVYGCTHSMYTHTFTWQVLSLDRKHIPWHPDTHLYVCTHTYVCTHIYMAGTIAESQANVLTHWHTCVRMHARVYGRYYRWIASSSTRVAPWASRRPTTWRRCWCPTRLSCQLFLRRCSRITTRCNRSVAVRRHCMRLYLVRACESVRRGFRCVFSDVQVQM